MYERLCWFILYAVLVLMVEIMGRWSEGNAWSVCQEICLEIVLCAIVMSGEVGCCVAVVGFLVGVLVLRMRWGEF